MPQNMNVMKIKYGMVVSSQERSQCARDSVCRVLFQRTEERLVRRAEQWEEHSRQRGEQVQRHRGGKAHDLSKEGGRDAGARWGPTDGWHGGRL